MPIQQLQPEFIRPIYEGLWASKPAAAGNAGKEIIVTDWNRSRWYSDGTYWRPVGGRAMMRNWVGANVSFSSGSPVQVLGVPGVLLPADLVATPGCSIGNRVQFHREAAAAVANQTADIRLGTSVSGRHLAVVQFTGATANQKFLIEQTRTINTGLTTFSQASSTTGVPVLTETYDPQLLSLLSGNTLIISGFGVDSGGSDVLYFDQWLTEVYA